VISAIFTQCPTYLCTSFQCIILSLSSHLYIPTSKDQSTFVAHKLPLNITKENQIIHAVPFLDKPRFPRPPYTTFQRYDIVRPRQSRIRRCAGQYEPCHWVGILRPCRLSHISLHRIQSYKCLLMLRCSTTASHIYNFSTFHSPSEDSINTIKEAIRLHTTLTPSLFRSLLSNLPPPSQISQTPLSNRLPLHFPPAVLNPAHLPPGHDPAPPRRRLRLLP
jgi:hypothetical protein